MRPEPIDLQVQPNKGYALLIGGGAVRDLTAYLNKTMVRHVPSPQKVGKVRGALKAFSFHWSNAQNAWDVISVSRDLPWGLDGAEFILFIGPKALSPVGKLWTLAEMRYVAKGLNPHPGAAFAVRATMVSRVTQRYAVQKAAPTYATRARQVTQQIKMLVRMLQLHDKKFQAQGGTDWGYVGDLGYIHEQLNEILNFME